MKHKKSQSAHSDMSLDEQALGYLERNGATSVQELYDVLSNRDPSLTKAEVTDMVWRLVERVKVDLEDVPPTTRSLGEYLRLWERNLWLYALLTMSLATVLAVYAIPSEFPFVALRWVLGSVFVLFIPGYVTVKALFPRGRELDDRTLRIKCWTESGIGPISGPTAQLHALGHQAHTNRDLVDHPHSRTCSGRARQTTQNHC